VTRGDRNERRERIIRASRDGGKDLGFQISDFRLEIYDWHNV